MKVRLPMTVLIKNTSYNGYISCHQIFKASPSFFSLTLSHTLGLVWLEVFEECDVVPGGNWILMKHFCIIQNIGMSVK